MTPDADRTPASTRWPVHQAPNDDRDRLLRMDMRLQRVEHMLSIANDRLVILSLLIAVATMAVAASTVIRLVNAP